MVLVDDLNPGVHPGTEEQSGVRHDDLDGKESADLPGGRVDGRDALFPDPVGVGVKGYPDRLAYMDIFDQGLGYLAVNLHTPDIDDL